MSRCRSEALETLKMRTIILLQRSLQTGRVLERPQPAANHSVDTRHIDSAAANIRWAAEVVGATTLVPVLNQHSDKFKQQYATPSGFAEPLSSIQSSGPASGSVPSASPSKSSIAKDFASTPAAQTARREDTIALGTDSAEPGRSSAAASQAPVSEPWSQSSPHPSALRDPSVQQQQVAVQQPSRQGGLSASRESNVEYEPDQGFPLRGDQESSAPKDHIALQPRQQLPLLYEDDALAVRAPKQSAKAPLVQQQGFIQFEDSPVNQQPNSGVPLNAADEVQQKAPIQFEDSPDLRETDPMAYEESPSHRATAASPPQLTSVGGEKTPVLFEGASNVSRANNGGITTRAKTPIPYEDAGIHAISYENAGSEQASSLESESLAATPQIASEDRFKTPVLFEEGHSASRHQQPDLPTVTARQQMLYEDLGPEQEQAPSTVEKQAMATTAPQEMAGRSPCCSWNIFFHLICASSHLRYMRVTLMLDSCGGNHLSASCYEACAEVQRRHGIKQSCFCRGWLLTLMMVFSSGLLGYSQISVLDTAVPIARSWI